MNKLRHIVLYSENILVYVQKSKLKGFFLTMHVSEFTTITNLPHIYSCAFIQLVPYHMHLYNVCNYHIYHLIKIVYTCIHNVTYNIYIYME